METQERILFLTINKKYYDEILSGTKTEEYRKISPFYISRIENREYDFIIFQNGYSKTSRRLKTQYLGYEKRVVRTQIYGEQELYVLKLQNPEEI